jgi:Asp-tRNA(Asn)/Glu-tRNA(Gln) amidotransferase A subunit family amidase
MDLSYTSIAELGQLLRRSEVSAVELAQHALDRLSDLGERLNAVATLTPELAMRQAEQADRELAAGLDRGPLHGIPYGAKDLLDTIGIPTQYGSPTHRGRVAKRDAPVIARLRSAGAVLAAKLAMVQLAGGGGYTNGCASLHGALRNPWDPGRWAGGSSSGSGAAVAAGLVPFTLGSETSGSIVCPASYCGVTGLRPTYGRVPRTGAMTLSWSLDKIGPMARSAAECALVLAVIAGPDGEDRTCDVGSFVDRARESLEGVRLGVLREDFAAHADAEIEPALHAAVAALEGMGARVEEAELPDGGKQDAVGTLIGVEAAAVFEELFRGEGLDVLTDERQREGLRRGLETPAVRYLRALETQERAHAAARDLFARCDLLVAASTLRVAPPVELDLRQWSRGGGAVVSWTNLAGLPAISLPMGFGEGGMPLGMQFVAAPGDEQRLLDAARAYQGVTDWHLRRPPGTADRRG